MKITRTKAAIALCATALTVTAGVAAADHMRTDNAAVTISEADAPVINQEFSGVESELNNMTPAQRAELDKAVEKAAQTPEGADEAPQSINLTDQEAAAIDQEFGASTSGS